MREIPITLTGGDRVDATVDGLTIATDQDGSIPAPFDLFLASIGTCAGFYVARFCRQRGIPANGVGIVQRHDVDRESRMIRRIEIEIRLPPGFPERYRSAVVRAAGQCAVKKHLERAPEFDIRVAEPTVRGDSV